MEGDDDRIVHRLLVRDYRSYKFYSQSTHLYKTKRPNMVACWFLCLLIPFSQAIARQRLEPDIVSRLGYALDGSMSLEPFHGC